MGYEKPVAAYSHSPNRFNVQVNPVIKSANCERDSLNQLNQPNLLNKPAA